MTYYFVLDITRVGCPRVLYASEDIDGVSYEWAANYIGGPVDRYIGAMQKAFARVKHKLAGGDPFDIQ